MSESIAAPRGTRDVTPGEVAVWQLLESVAAEAFRRYGYQEIRTPAFESTDLFARGIGTDTDIVGKEMYTFQDRSQRWLTLRPEGTAGVVRAYLEHKLYATAPSPLKLWYQGPMFRYERPQKGRQRQFHQIGVEVFGSGAPTADAEVIALAHDLYQDLFRAFAEFVRERLGPPAAARLEAPRLKVEINSLGDAACRPAYREALQHYFRTRQERYCEDCRRRMETNPLRVLDCKVPTCKELNQQAPPMTLCQPCSEHFDAVLRLLADVGVHVVPNPRIVRGLDYYTRTVFEIVPEDARQSGQTTICAGGRYDGLVQELGGPPTPAVGWALGQERAVEWLIEQVGRLTPDEAARLGSPRTEVYVGPLAQEALAPAFALAQELRRSGVAAIVGFEPGKPDRHLKQAIRQGARFLALLGPDELARGEVSLKNLQTRQQQSLPLDAERLATELGRSTSNPASEPSPAAAPSPARATP